MQGEITVAFPGGKKVDARLGDWTVHTDQSIKDGGDNSAPNPFALFLTSLASCAGYFALEFCQARDLNTSGLGLTMTYTFDRKTKQLSDVYLNIQLPQDFPEKYREALLRAVNTCPVKKNILVPPAITAQIDGHAPLMEGRQAERND